MKMHTPTHTIGYICIYIYAIDRFVYFSLEIFFPFDSSLHIIRSSSIFQTRWRRLISTQTQ